MIDVRPWLEKDGWCERWLRYCAPFEAPEAFSLFSVLACASAAINRRVRVNHGFKPCVYTNMYVALFAPAAGRKSDTLDEATRMLYTALPELPDLPDDFSMSSFIDELQERSKKDDKASGIIIGHELSDLLGGAEYRAENSRILTKLWDSPPHYRRKTRLYANEVLKHVYLCLAAVSSPEWMEQLDPETLDGGMLRRILCVVEHRLKQDSADPAIDDALHSSLAKRFRSRLRPGAFGGTEMRLTPKAKEANREWYMQYIVKAREGRSQRECGFINSMQAHAFKLAAVMHILEGGDPVELDEVALQRGQGLVMSLVPGTFELYASLTGTPFAKLRAATIRTLRGNGGAMVPAALDRAVRGSTGVKPREMIDVMETLLADGVVANVGGRIVLKEEKG